MGSTLDPQQVADDLARLAAELLGCDRAAVYRWLDGRWRLVASVPPLDAGIETPGPIEFGDQDLPLFRALRQNNVVEIADVDSQD
ncbi:MAG: GAF domain-containing protein, partial [Gaiellaceae bacterium]